MSKIDKLIQIIYENIEKKDLEEIILNRIKNELNKITYSELKRVEIIGKGEFLYFSFEVVKKILISNKYQINENLNELDDLEKGILENNEEFGEYIFKIVNKSKESLNVLNNFFIGTFFDDSEERIFKKILNKKIVIKEFVFDDCKNYDYIFSKIEKLEFEECTFNTDFNFIENKTYHFNNCIFGNKLTISNCQTFEDKSLFLNCKFKHKILIKNQTFNIILFRNCSIEVSLNVSNTIFNNFFSEDILQESNQIQYKNLVFNNCIFKKYFFLPMIENLIFENLTFHSCIFEKNISLSLLSKVEILIISYCNFMDNLILSSPRIEYLKIRDTSFFGNVDLGRSSIGEFELISSNFIKNCNFYNTKFIKDNNFRFTTFNQGVNFSKAKFNNINFSDTNFLGFVDFSEITNIENKQIECKNIKNRKTARILKSKLDEVSNIIESNNFYSIEMQKREDELKKDLKNGKNFFEWLVFKIHGISSNHSQDWLLALFWIISFTFLSVTIEKIFSSSLTSSDKGVLSLLVFSIIIASNIYLSNSKRVYYLIFIFIYYCIYSIFTQDLLLKYFSKTLNPFSLMQTDDPINGLQLLYKIIIAYLIYQFIVSIRQNTRRK